MADLKNFFELTSDLMGVASLEGRFQTVNAAFERMLGYHPNEIVGRSFIDLVHPDDYQESQFELVQIGYRAAAANTNTLHSDTARPDTVRFSNRCACKNGEWRQLEWTLSIVDGSLYCIGHDMTQRMDSLARYKLLADHATDIISRQTLTGDYLYVSPACYEVIGYSPEEMIGRNRYDFIHPGDVASIRSTMDRIDQQSETFSLVFRARHKAGHYVWMEAIQRKLQASDSSNTQTQTDPQAVKEVVVVARDVTKRILDQQKIQQFNQELEGRVTRRTQELEDSQSRYLELLKLEREGYARAELARATAQLYAEAVENMQVGLHIWQLKDFDDPTSLTLIATNPAAAKLIGIPVESVVNQRIAEAFPAVKNTDIPETYAGVVKSKIMVDLGEIIYGDSRVQRSIFAVKAFPLSEDCLGVAFDNITERKEAEAIRQDQAARLRILFDQSAVGLSRVSMAGEWMQVNQRLCDMLGYSMAELLGNNYRAVTHPDDLEVNQAAYKQLVDDHQPQVSYEKRYFTKSGEILWAHVTASLHKTKRGNIFGDSEDSVETESSYFIATIQDITQRKQAILALKKQKNDLVAVNMMLTNTMAQLEQRNSELDQFAYVTSHDLKAPLRA
ncbi:MAG: PAS domain S-box protein, partial [Cyanobacteria bacterium P01_A01_bin.17]